MLKLELKEIRAQQDLLFRFMSFLKQEGAVHVLQFCLTVGKISPWRSAPHPRAAAPSQTCTCSPAEEFNDRILSPELSEAELQRLHAEVQHIYQTYCLEDSADKIHFDSFVVEEIRSGTTSDATCRSGFSQRLSLPLMFCLLLLPQLLQVAMAMW